MKTYFLMLPLILFQIAFANDFTQSDIDSVYAFFTDELAKKPKIEPLDSELKIYNDLELFLNDEMKKKKTLFFKLGKKEFFSQMAQIVVNAPTPSLNERLQYLAQFIIKNYLENLKSELNQINSSFAEAHTTLKELIKLLDQSVEYANLSRENWYKKEFTSTKEILLEIQGHLDSSEWNLTPPTVTKSYLPQQKKRVKQKNKTSTRKNRSFSSYYKTDLELSKLIRTKLPRSAQSKFSPSSFMFDFIPVKAGRYQGLDFNNKAYSEEVNEDFEMMKYEVNQLLFYAVLKWDHSPTAYNCKDRTKVGTYRYNRYAIDPDKSSIPDEHDYICPYLPASRFSADDALLFVQKINAALNDGYEYFLPTDAQWGLALRASVQEKEPFFYNNGLNGVEDYAHFAGHRPVAGNHHLFSPNPRGFHHMLGNVAEWVSRDLTKTSKAAHFFSNNSTTIYYLRGGSFKSFREDIHYGSFFFSKEKKEHFFDDTTGLRLVRKRTK